MPLAASRPVAGCIGAAQRQPCRHIAPAFTPRSRARLDSRRLVVSSSCPTPGEILLRVLHGLRVRFGLRALRVFFFRGARRGRRRRGGEEAEEIEEERAEAGVGEGDDPRLDAIREYDHDRGAMRVGFLGVVSMSERFRTVLRQKRPERGRQRFGRVHAEQELPQVFLLTDRERKEYRCAWCETKAAVL